MSENDSPLQRAQKGLRITDVYMRNSTVGVSQAYEHRSFDANVLQPQFHHLVEKSEVLEEENGKDGQRLFRVFVDLGCRWGFLSDESADADKDEEHKNEVESNFEELGRIEAKFVAEYEITEELSQECLDAFALKNASYHVWPYWREYVTSSCARMNVPKLVMPTIQPVQNRHVAAAEKKSSNSV